jgi:hypothetical protein
VARRRGGPHWSCQEGPLSGAGAAGRAEGGGRTPQRFFVEAMASALYHQCVVRQTTYAGCGRLLM